MLKKKNSLPRGKRLESASPDALSTRHEFLSQELVGTFQVLRVGATLRDETGWYSVHDTPTSIQSFEYTHGLAPERYAYNNAAIASVQRSKKALLGEHAGFSDFFVPIATRDAVEAVLVTGPLSTRRPTSVDLLQHWRALTGRQGHPSNPEFLHYLNVALDTLVLEGDLLESYSTWLDCYVSLIAGRGNARVISLRASELRAKLERARSVERTWEVVSSMLNELTEREWLSPHGAGNLLDLGMEQLPAHVCVGLLRPPSADSNAVESLIELRRFQRACVDLARSKHQLCGRVGDHGIVVLVGGARSQARLESVVTSLVEDVAALGRQSFGLSLHFGSSGLTAGGSPSAQYAQALRAAERALTEGKRLVHANSTTIEALSPLRELRLSLGSVRAEAPQGLKARFERYIAAAAAGSGYRVEIAKMQLEAGFDQAAQALISAGSLTQRSYMDLCRTLEQATLSAGTISDLLDAYRRAVADLIALAEHPASATRDQSLRRAKSFIHRHFAEPLSVPEVARVAGFAPRYFSRLFQALENMTFDAYVRKLRIERAKQLLKATDLSVERVGELSGFGLRPYFHRVFSAEVGQTPREYRQRSDL